MLRHSYSTLASVTILLVAVTTTEPSYAEPSAFSSSNIHVRATKSEFPNPTLQDNEDYSNFDTNNTGAFAQSQLSHFVFGPAPGEPGGVISDSPGFGETYGEAELSSGTLKSYSYTKVDVSNLDLDASDKVRVASFTSVGFGDSFSTTTGSGSPFIWGAGDVGTFSMDLDGDFFKAFQDGDGVLEFGKVSWQVNLLLTTPDDTTARFSWGAGMGAFDADEPFRIFSTATAFGDACIVCEASMPVDLSGAVDPAGTLIDDNLTARFNVGGDFDWILSLATLAEVQDQTDEVKSNYFNTLNVSYLGPDGSLTNAAVFDSFSSTAPVPLPASFYLLGVGLLGLLRQRKQISSR